MGQDLFICSAYVIANEFITISDDIELIDLVEGHSAKKIWHCSSLEKSDMLSQAVADAYYSAQGIDPDGSRNPPDWQTSKQITSNLQFLGIVSLYTNQSGNKVTAFRLHSFVLYSFDKKSKSTVVHMALTEARLTLSTAPERVLQILQLVQAYIVQSTALTIAPLFTMSDSVERAYMSLGFSKSILPQREHAVLTRKAVFELPRFTNRIMWGRYGQYISLEEECSSGEAIPNMYCRFVLDLFLHSHDPMHALGIRYEPERIEAAISSAIQGSDGIHHDVALCSKLMRKLASGLTRIPLAVITHVLVNRVASLKGVKAFYETTLELLQHVSIAMVTAASHHEIFVGDCHSCVLYCEKCKCRFGRTGNIYQVLAESTNAILYHNGLEVPHGPDSSVLVDDNEQFLRFKQSLPMHSMPTMTGQFSLTILSAMDPDHDRCMYGTGRLDLTRHEKKKNIEYLHNLDEAMRIDTFFAGPESVMNTCNLCTSALLLSTFDVALHLHFRTREVSKFGGNTESFKDYALDVNNAEEIGTTWIESHCDQLLNNQHRRMGLCHFTPICVELHIFIQANS